MKRRRRLFTPFRWRVMEWNAYGGAVIPPRSIVKPNEVAAKEYGSENVRIGYYGHVDGLNCVWLVNSKGEYFGATDQRYINENFEIIERSDETDVYGDNRPVLEPLASAS